MAGVQFGLFTVCLFHFVAYIYGRHLDKERDYSNCAEGLVPIGVKNKDGFLELRCMKPRCEEINKVKAVCSGTYVGSCPSGAWVGGVHREFVGTDEQTLYKPKCCTHPIFKNTIAVKPLEHFKPGDQAIDGAVGQGETVDIVTNVGPNSQYDVHSVTITTVMCGRSTSSSRSTARSTAITRKPTTEKTDNKNNNNQNGNHGAGGGSPEGNNGGNNGGDGGGASNGGTSGGKSGPKGGKSGGGSSEHGCGPTGCPEPKLQGGSENHYEKQNVPLPGKPSSAANDPKAWGVAPGRGAGAGGGGGGCFSADTIVQTRRGHKRMEEIQLGDEVLSSVSWDGNSAVSYQPITQFIHKDQSVFTRYTVINTNTGKSLSLTPYHLLPQFDCALLERPTISVREYEILFTQSARFAHRARSGQCVLVVDMDGKLVAERITNVTAAIERGVFSPITASGIIVANGIQTSCYSSVENHALQHAFFSFVRKVSQAWKPYVDAVKSFFAGQSASIEEYDGQIPALLRVMMVLSDLVTGISY